jgi:hypothetical protein
MADTLFDFAAERLEHHAALDRLEARGTLRIALKAAGVEPKSLTTKELQAVIEKVLPEELGARAVNDVPNVCAAMLAELEDVGDVVADTQTTDPDEIFRRLGNG